MYLKPAIFVLFFLELVVALGFGCMDPIPEKLPPLAAMTPTPLETRKTVQGVINPAGWSIPKIDGMTAKKRGVAVQRTKDGTNIDVGYTLFRPDQTRLMAEAPAMFGREIVIQIESMTELNHRGNVFAYSFAGAEVTKREGQERFSQIGPGIVWLLVDEDGDGKFEYFGSDPIVVPSWVQTRSSP